MIPSRIQTSHLSVDVSVVSTQAPKASRAAAVGAGLAPSIGVPGETDDTDVTRKPSAVASAG